MICNSASRTELQQSLNPLHNRHNKCGGKFYENDDQNENENDNDAYVDDN